MQFVEIVNEEISDLIGKSGKGIAALTTVI